MNCKKCGREITIGELMKDDTCETCLGIENPWDNPEKYKYPWNGRLVSLDELPPIARLMFPTLNPIQRKYRGLKEI